MRKSRIPIIPLTSSFSLVHQSLASCIKYQLEMIRNFSDFNLDDILIDPSQHKPEERKEDNLSDDENDNENISQQSDHEYTDDFDDASPIKREDRTMDIMDSYNENDDQYDADVFDEVSRQDISIAPAIEPIKSSHLNKLFSVIEGVEEDRSLSRSILQMSDDAVTRSDASGSHRSDSSSSNHSDKSSNASYHSAGSAKPSVEQPVAPIQEKSKDSLAQSIASNAYPSTAKASLLVSSQPTARLAAPSTLPTTINNDSNNATSLAAFTRESVHSVVQEVLSQQTEIYKSKIIENHYITSSIAAATALRQANESCQQQHARGSAAVVNNDDQQSYQRPLDPYFFLPADIQQLVRLAQDTETQAANVANITTNTASKSNNRPQDNSQQLFSAEPAHVPPQRPRFDIHAVQLENARLREALAERQQQDDRLVNRILSIDRESFVRAAVGPTAEAEVDKQQRQQQLSPKVSASEPTFKGASEDRATRKTRSKSQSAKVRSSSLRASGDRVRTSTNSARDSINPLPSRPPFVITYNENPNHHSYERAESPMRHSVTFQEPVTVVPKKSAKTKTTKTKKGTAAPPHEIICQCCCCCCGSDPAAPPAAAAVTATSTAADKYSVTVLDPNSGRSYKVLRPRSSGNGSSSGRQSATEMVAQQKRVARQVCCCRNTFIQCAQCCCSCNGCGVSAQCKHTQQQRQPRAEFQKRITASARDSVADSTDSSGSGDEMTSELRASLAANSTKSDERSADLLVRQRLKRPDVADKCDKIYATFLSDLIDMCKRRADEATSSEELAMHRVLSSYVSNAFAARAVHGIQAGMVSAALEVSAKDKKK